MKNITVIDSIMGSGKSTWARQYINDHPEKNFLYITPFLSEIQETKNAVVRTICEPLHLGKTKYENLKSLLSKGYDIATTHALFKYLDDETINLIKENNYTLIMDESFEPIAELKIAKDDIEDLLFKSGIITKDDPDSSVSYISWNPECDDYKATFRDLKRMCHMHQVICIKGEDNRDMLIWEYPPKVFEAFDHVYVMTYMFNSCMMYYYFNIHNVSYNKVSMKSGQIVDYYIPDTTQFQNYINIYHGSLNINFPNDRYALSKNWYGKKSNRKYINQLKKNIYNYFYNLHKGDSKYKMWSTFKDFKNRLAGKGYTTRFLSMNARATNDYKDVEHMAYCCNVFMPSIMSIYLKKHNMKIDNEGYALSLLIQWIWRSRIRQKEILPINIYLPSMRMRQLLCEWLQIDFEKTQSLDKKKSQRYYPQK